MSAISCHIRALRAEATCHEDRARLIHDERIAEMMFEIAKAKREAADLLEGEEQEREAKLQG